jgi:hypothetical protein
MSKPICYVEFLWSPSGSGETERPIYSVAEAIEVIDYISATESEPATGNVPTAWATVVLRRGDGERLHVGKSDAAWLLILLRGASGPTRILRGNLPPGPWVVFLIPEWTDFERKDLVEPDRGQAAIEAWLRGDDPASVLTVEA